MKKILLSGIALGSCFLLASCGTTNEQATVTQLSNQLDRLNNVVANSATISTDDISLSSYASNNEDLVAIRDIYQRTENSINQQNSYKQEILNRTAAIKSSLASQDLKLGSNASAIKELSNTLSKYTTKLANTNNDYKKTAKTISKMRANSNTSASELGAKLTRLSSCSDSRSCYYNNLLYTLNQIQSLLGNETTVQDGTLDNRYFNNYADQMNTPAYNFPNRTQNDVGINQINQDYKANMAPQIGYYTDENGNCVNGHCPPNTAYYQNNGYHIYQNGALSARNSNMYGNYPSNDVKYNGNGYRNNTFNPNRNTDTYAPGVTNIDTYRPNPVNPNSWNNNVKIDDTFTTDDTSLVTDVSKEVKTTEQNTKNESKKEIKDVSENTKDIKENNSETSTLSENDKPMTLENNVSKNESVVNNANKPLKESKNVTETKKQEQTPVAPTMTHEDGNQDRDPKMKNLRYAEKENRRNSADTSKPNTNTKTANETETSLSLQPDYKATNKKIKELIESSAPVCEEVSFLSFQG